MAEAAIAVVFSPSIFSVVHSQLRQTHVMDLALLHCLPSDQKRTIAGQMTLPSNPLGPTQGEAELLHTPELDEEDSFQAGVRLATDIWVRILAIAEFEKIEQSEPARSQMIFEANFFAAACSTFHAEKWYSQEPERRKFVEGLKGQFALVLALSVEASNKNEVASLAEQETLRSEYKSLLDLRDQEYRATRARFRSRFFRLFLGKAAMDAVFLDDRTRLALGRHKAVTSARTRWHFVTRTVREVHVASEMSSRAVTPLKVLVVLATVSAAVALLPLPYGFYMLLRVIFCLTAVVNLMQARAARRVSWLWIYGVLAVLYNPVLPVHLILRPLWVAANLVTIVLFWAGLPRLGNLDARGVVPSSPGGNSG